MHRLGKRALRKTLVEFGPVPLERRYLLVRLGRGDKFLDRGVYLRR